MRSALLIRRIAALLTVLTTGLLVGCSPEQAPTNAAQIHIVATTNVWGDIAATVAGPDAVVTSLIHSTTQSPHDYVASARDLVDIEHADLIVVNGNGYDEFAEQLIDASNTHASIIRASSLSPRAESNEHYWFDTDTVRAVSQGIAAALSRRDPSGATGYVDRAERFESGIAAIAAQLDAARRAHAAAPPTVLMTEPLPGYAFRAAGYRDVTPTALSRAVEGGSDIPPAALSEALDLIRSGAVTVLALNDAETSAQTQLLTAAAEQHGVAILRFAELLPDGVHVLDWLRSAIEGVVAESG